MGLIKLKSSLLNFIKSERGAGKNLVILGPSSLVIGYLFTAITLANIRAQEREAHYYNATQMAEGLKWRLENSNVVNTSKVIKTYIHTSQLQFTDQTENGTDSQVRFTLQELIDYNMLKEAPDATRSRLDGDDISYDTTNSIIEVKFLDDEGVEIDDRTETYAKIVFQVNLVGKSDSATGLLNSDYSDQTGHAYISMVNNEEFEKNDVIEMGLVKDILSKQFKITDSWVKLPDDELDDE